MELTNDLLRLTLSYEGEGWGGYYDEEDPEDEKLLRFSLYQRDSENPAEWVSIDDTSYCTALPESTLHHLQRLVAESMFAEFTSAYKTSPPESLRGLARFFSWLSASDVALLDSSVGVSASPTP